MPPRSEVVHLCTHSVQPCTLGTVEPTSISVSRARAVLPQLLQRVLAGEEITLTRHGAAVAVVIRPDRLRARRADAALDRAATVHDAIASGRQRELGTISPETADDLMKDVKRARARR